ncbi:SusC/RagA family TonB-linked outer membrane protein [Echinicola strongylocentroti]|uniref:SusC/RagA family TonB-linked outer membrane protein n=1 Tax=Echinicola strongylocentroti TaxID=1795355 RepID=A0A2Z4IGH6_9BACT|nr:TonB-dependent receptor [Echinicola strongylocentroti]AWW29553.1 SusC/RagA family TonB-linked outer membrane protein [Echinicola strongylocentroti]
MDSFLLTKQRIITVLACFLWLCWQPVLGQGIMVKGTVTEAGNGAPIIGATIMEMGTNNGTVTDIDGKYSIEVSEGAQLQFSFIGMQSKVLEATPGSLDVSLDSEDIGLDEVVVVGYGVQKKANLTGAVASVGEEVLERRPVQNAFQALQGQVPGLNISQNNGNPGAEGVNVTIRGLNSFGSSNSPLVLINGVEGNLNDLDPSVIKSVSVLKDASSAAIYGLKAANGVILVETKKGYKEGVRVKYEGSYAINTPTVIPEMISNSADYMTLYNRALDNAPGDGGNYYPQEIIEAYRTANNDPYYPNTDWTDLVTQTGSVWRNTLGVDGTSGTTSYNITLGNWKQKGIMSTSEYDKNNIFVSINSDITDRITVGGNIMGMYSKRQGPNSDWTNPLTSAWSVRPTWGPYTLDGTGHYAAKAFSGSTEDPDFLFDEGFTRENPIARLYGQKGYSDEKYNFNGNLYANIDILPNLRLSMKGAMKFDYMKSKFQQLRFDEYNYRTGEFLRRTTDPAKIDANNVFSTVTTFYSTLAYDKIVNEIHDFTFMGGYSQEFRKRENTVGSRYGVPTTTITELDGAGTDNQLVGGTNTQSAVRSFFARVNYVFNEKYLIESNIRSDVSSRFAEGSRMGIFPSFSVGWRLENEPFLYNATFIDQLKLRASWGQLGNDGDIDYPYQAQYSFGNYELNNYVQTRATGSHGYPFGIGIAPGVVLEKFTDPNITWETTTIANIGLDISLWSGKLTAGIDYFDKVTDDILRELQVSIEAGASGPQINQGKMRNRGMDFVLGHRNNIGDWSYNLSGNIAFYNNEILNYGAREIYGFTANEEGYPLNGFYMWESDGLFRSQEDIDNAPTQPLPAYLGGIRLKDQNGDGVVDTDDRIHLDGQHPAFTYGANVSASFKQFDFSMFWQGVAGQKTYRNNHGVEPFVQDGNAPSVWLNQSWTRDNVNAPLPTVYNETLSNYDANSYANSFWLRNTSYLRMKNVSLGYTFPEALTERLKLTKLRLYFSGDNLVTFTDNDLFQLDPEVLTSYTYPLNKSYTFGVSVTL